MIRTTRRSLRSDTTAVSAVIGTILMIAATVILGGVVYVAINGFGDKETPTTTDAVFRVQGIDTDDDGKTDKIKVTYIAGPEDVPADEIKITTNLTSPAITPGTVTSWSPGTFVVISRGTDAKLEPATYIVTVSIRGSTVVDTTVTIG